jgi:hypothetical protein
MVSVDFYGDAYTGEIDTVTGFALVASTQTCFVWQHAQVRHSDVHSLVRFFNVADRLSEELPLVISFHVHKITAKQALRFIV